jgi:hypothetical protein
MKNLTIPNEDLTSWLAELKPYQRNTLISFSSSLGPEEAAERWLTTIGLTNIAGFGGSPFLDHKPFWDKFKAECNKFICDDKSYVEEKASLLKEANISKTMLISVISGAIGATLGTMGTLIAPAVTLILFTVGQLGLNAYCASPTKPTT